MKASKIAVVEGDVQKETVLTIRNVFKLRINYLSYVLLINNVISWMAIK